MVLCHNWHGSTYEEQKFPRTLVHLFLRSSIILIPHYLAVMWSRYGQRKVDGAVVPTYGLHISFFFKNLSNTETDYVKISNLQFLFAVSRNDLVSGWCFSPACISVRRALSTQRRRHPLEKIWTCHLQAVCSASQVNSSVCVSGSQWRHGGRCSGTVSLPSEWSCIMQTGLFVCIVAIRMCVCSLTRCSAREQAVRRPVFCVCCCRIPDLSLECSCCFAASYPISFLFPRFILVPLQFLFPSFSPNAILILPFQLPCLQ
jgi:hypothetical protein